jgi:branched-chain amino acid transport system substrate-binding protein
MERQKTTIINTRRRFPPIAYLLFTIAVLWGSNQIWQHITQPYQADLTDRSSIGERLLIKEIDSSEKREGINSFANADYDGATQHFQSSLQIKRNDPESQIYQQNSMAIQKVGDAKKLVKIAVVVPIGSNTNIAQEMLRGVSQMQLEINQSGGINGLPIVLQIFNDDNNPKIAAAIANQVIKDSQTVAVIGSNTSDASLASAPIYQKAGLVTITPTSLTRDLSGIGSFVLRTTPTSQSLTSTLAKQIFSVDRHKKLAICFDSKASDSVTFKEDLIAEFARLGGEIASFTCDVAAADFSPNSAIDKAKNLGADSLFIASHIDRLPLALQVAAANNGSLPLYSSPTLNTFATLQAGSAVSGLTLVTPWQNPLEPQSGSFADRAQRLWGAKVSWRTAMSYDAGMATITGLRQSNGTRLGLQQALHHPQFSAEGASERVKFLPTGDRVFQPKIAQVRQVDGQWVFAPPQPPATGQVPQLDRSVFTLPPQK